MTPAASGVFWLLAPPTDLSTGSKPSGFSLLSHPAHGVLHLPHRPIAGRALRTTAQVRAPCALTAGQSAEDKLEGHEHVAQVVGLRYDLHAAVLGLLEHPPALEVRVAQFRVAHVADMQEPEPHVPQGPGWGELGAGNQAWSPPASPQGRGEPGAAPRAGEACGQGPGRAVSSRD